VGGFDGTGLSVASAGALALREPWRSHAGRCASGSREVDQRRLGGAGVRAGGRRVTFAGVPQIEELAPPGVCEVVRNAVATTAQESDFIDIISDSAQVLDYLEVEPAG
jgi:hypothetical protein